MSAPRRIRLSLVPKKAKPNRPQLYRQFFTPAECESLDATAEDDASSEISLLRVLLIRAMAAARRARRLTLKDRASVLAAISSSGLIMASLVRFEGKYHNPFAELSDIILQAFAAMDPYDL